MGEPPIAYLTEWRIALAADLLRETDATVAAVAQRVGYVSAFSLSSAFKRVRGVSPREFRQRGTAAEPPKRPPRRAPWCCHPPEPRAAACQRTTAAVARRLGVLLMPPTA